MERQNSSAVLKLLKKFIYLQANNLSDEIEKRENFWGNRIKNFCKYYQKIGIKSPKRSIKGYLKYTLN